jgi:hypothetical protein
MTAVPRVTSCTKLKNIALKAGLNCGHCKTGKKDFGNIIPGTELCCKASPLVRIGRYTKCAAPGQPCCCLLRCFQLGVLHGLRLKFVFTCQRNKLWSAGTCRVTKQALTGWIEPYRTVLGSRKQRHLRGFSWDFGDTWPIQASQPKFSEPTTNNFSIRTAASIR